MSLNFYRKISSSDKTRNGTARDAHCIVLSCLKWTFGRAAQCTVNCTALSYGLPRTDHPVRHLSNNLNSIGPNIHCLSERICPSFHRAMQTVCSGYIFHQVHYTGRIPPVPPFENSLASLFDQDVLQYHRTRYSCHEMLRSF